MNQRLIHLFCATQLVCFLTLPMSAQTPARISIETEGATNIALTITGSPGTLYAIEYATHIGENSSWQVASVLQLPASPHVWREPILPGTLHRFYRVAAIGLEPVTNMVWISPGTFLMGSPLTEADRRPNEPQHHVTLTQGFWMGKYEVTQGEYVSLTGNNPSVFRNGTNAFGSGGPVTNDVLHPVDSISWFDATNYCGRLTAEERQAGRLPSDWEYRLPTEAEWEYACRAGTTTSHHYGDALSSGMANFRGFWEFDASLGTIQNDDGEYLGRTREVGAYDPNPWGLHDMHGNVWEWCLDWRGDYPAGPVTNPKGPAEGLSRIHRGGEWGITASYCRSARRFGGDPAAARSNVGFRIVLAPTP